MKKIFRKINSYKIGFIDWLFSSYFTILTITLWQKRGLVGSMVKNFFGLFGNKPPSDTPSTESCYCSEYFFQDSKARKFMNSTSFCCVWSVSKLAILEYDGRSEKSNALEFECLRLWGRNRYRAEWDYIFVDTGQRFIQKKILFLSIFHFFAITTIIFFSMIN